MPVESPAAILVDINGNPIGSIQDGTIFRLQTEDKIASWLGSIAPTVGQKTSASSIPMVIASDQTVIPINVGVSTISPVGDTFNHIRVASPSNLFEANHNFDLLPLTFQSVLTGSTASLTYSQPYALLNVGTTNGDKVVFQSKRYIAYQPGRSQTVSMTFVPAANNALSGAGYTDGTDGVAFEQDNTGIYINFVSSTIASQRILQANWNLDTLDGYGSAKNPSGIRLDWTQAQHIYFDFAWHGVGILRCGFYLKGQIVFVHQFFFSNTQAGAFWRTGSLPLQFYVKSLGSAATMKAICSSVHLEGGASDVVGLIWAQGRTSAKSVTGTSAIPLITLRPSLTHNGLVNRATVVPITYSIKTDTDVLIQLIVNGTLTSASFSAVSANGYADTDTSATAISGGRIIATSYTAANNSNTNSIYSGVDSRVISLTLDVPGTTPDTISVCAVVLGTGATANVFASIQWQEQK